MSKNTLFQGQKIVLFLLKQKTKHEKKENKTRENQDKLIRWVWGQVRSPFGQPHLTLKPCKPNQKHKTKKQNKQKQNKPKQKKTDKEGPSHLTWP